MYVRCLEIVMTSFDEKLMEIGKQYQSPEEFKKANAAKFFIAKSHGLLRKLFPEDFVPKTYTNVPTEEEKSIEGLRDALEEYISKLSKRTIRTGQYGHVKTRGVINKLRQLLKEHEVKEMK